MLVFVLLIAIGAVVVGAGTLLLGAGRGFDDVDRFHRARGITTGWAREAMTRPVVAPRSPERAEAEREHAASDA